MDKYCLQEAFGIVKSPASTGDARRLDESLVSTTGTSHTGQYHSSYRLLHFPSLGMLLGRQILREASVHIKR